MEEEVASLNNLYMEHQLNHLRTELQTLIPHTREKRGLLNIVGTGLKYIYGTMDDNDRREIESQLQVLETNTHNAITQSNNQIQINEQFDEQLEKLTTLYSSQMKKIIEQYTEMRNMSTQQQKN